MKIRLFIILLLSLSIVWAVDYPSTTEIPMISVSITGYVPAPGVYHFTPTSRLSDVLSQQDALELKAKEMKELVPEAKDALPRYTVPDAVQEKPEPTLEMKSKQALRSIKLTRDGKTEVYDLLRFYRLGEASQNPRLKDGDLVLVEAVQETVELEGAINLPGKLEFVDGDRLQDVIALAKGLEFDADPALAKLYRYQSNHIDFSLIPLDLSISSTLSNTSLQTYDRIYIPRSESISKQRRVTVSGQVKNPGEYVINDSSTLYDILMQAGGISSKADIENLVCYNEYLHGGNTAFQDFLLQRSMSDMTPIEYSYLRTNLQQLKGKYSLEPAKMWNSEGKEANPLLHDGDRIYIPEKMDMVMVSGQVKYPGMVPWVKGADWEYYISQAGGYTNNRKAGRGRLIRGFSGNWVKPKKDIVIMAGDTVFVPSQTDRSLWTDVKDIVTLISSTITIIVGVQALSN